MHDDVVRSVLPGFGGREIETAGDSFLVAFDNVESAIRCGLALVGALAAIQLPIRVGVHSAEVVLVSGTTRDLAEGAAGLMFESRGRFRLKDLSRELEVFSAGSSG
jgi:class 3 adenylate cyclase